jgi:heme oxygenase
MNAPPSDGEPLSAQLRARTAPLHTQSERLLGLPHSITGRADYIAWLGRFLGLYDPLERRLAGFAEWPALGIDLASRSLTQGLTADLVALGADPTDSPRAAEADLPPLPSLAHAIGALYVLEGSALGGRIILRDLQGRLGDHLGEATRFFGGRGERLGPMWNSFRGVLDRFGETHPQLTDAVQSGADATFTALIRWFTPFCGVGGGTKQVRLGSAQTRKGAAPL